jgi:EAL domain-containing protein (putative c-di-GMP-specific phosphodiesterase class I)
VHGLKAGVNFSRFGVNLRIAINISIAALVKLPVGDIVREHHQDADAWPGLILDLTEEQIVKEISLACEMTEKLAPYNVRLAIDDLMVRTRLLGADQGQGAAVRRDEA